MKCFIVPVSMIALILCGLERTHDVPNYDLAERSHRACEYDRAQLIRERMLANAVRDPWSSAAIEKQTQPQAMGHPIYHREAGLPLHISRTLNWVRRSCQQDSLPDWLIALVVQQVQRELLAGNFPTLLSE